MFWKHKKPTLNCSLLFFLLLLSAAICSSFYKAPPVLRLIPMPHPRLGQVARGRSSNGRIWSSSALAQKTEIWVETKKPDTDEAQFRGVSLGVWVWMFWFSNYKKESVITFFFALVVFTFPHFCVGRWFFFYFVSFYVSVVLVLTFEVSFCAVRLQKTGLIRTWKTFNTTHHLGSILPNKWAMLRTLF